MEHGSSLTSRRDFMMRGGCVVLGGIGLAPMLGCGRSSPALPTSTTVTSSSTIGTPPDSTFARVPANPTFVFATNLNNVAGAGVPAENSIRAGLLAFEGRRCT